jgi:hypothetical protein
MEHSQVTEYRSSPAEKPEPVMHTADSVRDQCSMLLWDIAPARQGEKLEGWLHRVAVLTGLKPNQAKRLRYKEVSTVPAHVADLLRDIAAQQKVARERALAQRFENDRLLAFARSGERLDRSQVPGPTTVVREESEVEDGRQLNLAFRGWMR